MWSASPMPRGRSRSTDTAPARRWGVVHHAAAARATSNHLPSIRPRRCRSFWGRTTTIATTGACWDRKTRSYQRAGTLLGLMQGTGTSKSLFENPVVDSGGGSLSLDPSHGVPSPGLADVGSLLGASGIFPAIGNVLKIPAKTGDALSLAQDGFQKTFSWPLGTGGQTSTTRSCLIWAWSA